MKNKIEINDQLLAKYLSGEAEPEEAMALDDWLREPSNRLHFNEIQKMWAASFPSRSYRPVELDKAWTKIQSAKKTGQFSRPRVISWGSKSIMKIAASILLILAIGGALYVYRSAEPAYIELASGDSLKHIRLEERSLVVLNRNAHLIYPQKFTEAKREVKLVQGEAFFNITPDSLKPFLVNTEIATIKVLGTAFNVLIKSDSLEVSVEHGKVLVFTSTDSIHLEGGQAALTQTADKTFKNIDSNMNTWAYATHKFVFNNTSVRDVFRYVEKAQDCTIHLADPGIGNCKLTATFESVSTDYMLNLITEALNLSVTKNDDRTFTVEGEGCH